MTCLPSKSPYSRTSSERSWTGASRATSSESPKGKTKMPSSAKSAMPAADPSCFSPTARHTPGSRPVGPTALVDGELYEANFVKVAVNVMRKKGEKQNRLADVLRAWFGPKAGLPGTNKHVAFRQEEGKLILEPLKKNEIHSGGEYACS